MPAVNAREKAAYEAAMTENTLLKAVLDDLKAEGCVPATASRPVRDCARRQPAPDPHTRVPWDLEEPLRVPPGEAPIVHSDRGGRYRWPERIAICEAAGLTRSMSRKGRSCDNARAEGFFGLLGREFFHGRDWTGVGAGEFSAVLDEWMRWFRSGRISQALGWLTPDEHRLALEYAV